MIHCLCKNAHRVFEYEQVETLCQRNSPFFLMGIYAHNLQTERLLQSLQTQQQD